MLPACVESLEDRVLMAAGLTIEIKRGPNLAKNAAASAAFRKGADFLESLFSDPITVVVDAEIQPMGAQVIGQTTSVQFHYARNEYDGIRDLLVRDASGAEKQLVSRLPKDSQLKVVLPRSTGASSFTRGGLTATRANLLAVGMSPSKLQGGANSRYSPGVKRDMSITFSSDFNFDYDRSNGISPGAMDFTGIVIHELGHGLGFLSEVDTADFLMDLPGLGREIFPAIPDLFRLRPGAGKVDFTNSPRILAPGDQEPRQVFYDGGFYDPAKAGLKITGQTRGDIPMATGASFGDGDQASHWKDNDSTGVLIGIFDPSTSPGVALKWTQQDTRALGLIGWDVKPGLLPGGSTPAPKPPPTPPAGGSVSGVAFNDADGDGVKDAGESARPGLTVWVDANRNGSRDAGEKSTVTTSTGTYRISGLAAGSYQVRATTPASSVFTVPASGAHNFVLATSQNLSGRNFGVASAARVVRSTLPAGWSARDVGSVGRRGFSTFSNNTFTVRGSGADIFGTTDGFHFAHKTLRGDGEIVARVANVWNTNDFAKAGVMIRQGTGANAPNAFMAVTRAGGLRFTTRTAAGRTTLSRSASGAAPTWVRLVRKGNQFTAYRSANGLQWTLVGSQSVAMTGDLQIGLAVTSHDNTLLNISTFDNVKVTSG
jgi:hypothetical protein